MTLRPKADAAPPLPTERLFVAITLPGAIQQTLAATARPVPGVTWARPEQLHLTLRFLGDVPAPQLAVIAERFAAIHVSGFLIPLEGLGTFPPHSPPRVVWLGIGSGHPRLFQLRQRLDDALIAAGVQFDFRTFHPHVTLGRCTSAAPGLAAWLHQHRDFAAPPFRVEAFDLYASELQPSGAIHTLKQRFPLAK